MNIKKCERRKVSQTFYLPFELRNKMVGKCKKLGISISEYISMLVQSELDIQPYQPTHDERR
jgi:hypothetical protein